MGMVVLKSIETQTDTDLGKARVTGRGVGSHILRQTEWFRGFKKFRKYKNGEGEEEKRGEPWINK